MNCAAPPLKEPVTGSSNSRVKARTSPRKALTSVVWANSPSKSRARSGPSAVKRVVLNKSMDALSDYLSELTADLYTYLGTLPAVHILGVTGEAAAGQASGHGSLKFFSSV